ncbi:MULTISPECIES: chemotaxis protein CheW [unclassified Cupriavidus]|uniref:chemotaxis protein CheW n=1 Tax=unclassified Cupriavidus TaxID=2640874 RepID=UPI001C00136B|nr:MULTISPECIES: chemotaxis protein CheW [unclassified Cupriavidus]MCA3183762.1 purine-binding chemotaxis protein CheW [Cupriavidus sp.]MCA3188792.1 purine-binding chemotaxis protein CheW [Cupriavidus sp.]MCA3198512.1 purine-binding chemotaxis protein CheW [Cupriavidus sp.]MCA3201258.1 purine-binding chemotaxis protein CheW [Cupriavidus sp.]MCA3208460.1 purine-binding chemotaxis protein CheW [Cupriavidus sp.]
MADSIVQHASTTLPGLAAGTVYDCWRRIGTGGDRSCPKLKDCLRCRNCPVYAQAAVTVLDSLSAGSLWDSTTDNAIDEDTPSQDRVAGQSLLIFRVGDEWLALPTAALGEITAPVPVHSLPHRRHAALIGVAAVRGVLLTCVSLALLFGAPESAAQPATRCLILGQGRNAIALPVAEVAGVEQVPRHALLPLPATLTRASSRYTQALFEHGGRSVGLLDADLLRQALSRSLA